MRSRHATGAAAILTCIALATGACQNDAPTRPAASPSPSSSSASAIASVPLTFGVWGNRSVRTAFEQAVRAYDQRTETSSVTVRSWPSDADMMKAYAGGQTLPDVFLISRADLADLRSAKQVEPVDSFLDARAVDTGDNYSREALEAFSAEHRLQCMPYAVSPQVVYYNTDLVDFARMEATGVKVPAKDDNSRWTLEDFTAAATFATQAKAGARGFAVDETLQGLAPFLYSGGGSVVDDEEQPTSLALSSDESRDALGTALATLRDAQLTLTPQMRAKASALTWFKRGRLGMIVGDRSLVPELRKQPDLRFDVMPMPTIDNPATIGDFTGICLSATSEHAEEAANLLVALTADESVQTVAKTGYVVPANQQVALSQEFLQPELQPLHSQVFTGSVRSMHILPLTDQWADLERRVAAPVRALFTAGPTLDLDAVTQRIDADSRLLLSPTPPSADPSASPSASPSS